MLYGIYKIKQILETSDFDFNDKHGMNREWITYLGLNDILTDYTDMFRMLSEIEDIIDKIIHDKEGDENHELQRSTGTEI